MGILAKSDTMDLGVQTTRIKRIFYTNRALYMIFGTLDTVG